ncbi:MAG TPA: BTAD domain-containing putative transcriptional regulator [Longimicrobiales bacterium]|nr:BTAD domain-containing putative transcriptional regulator [Longimicrobiales bacterium]
MIRLRTLGGTEVDGTVGEDGGEILAHPDRTALLVYLAVAGPGTFRRRDTLHGLLWPETGEETARAALDGAIRDLERSVGPDVLIEQGDAEIGLAEGAVWCDAVAFEHAVEQARFGQALELYRGDFLPGFSLPESLEFGRWITLRRGLLRSRASAAAWALADNMEVLGDRAAAVEFGRRAVAADPDDETAVRRLVGLLARTGDGLGALDAYGAFAAHVAQAYDREPALETQALAAAVRSRVHPADSSAADGPAPISPSSRGLAAAPRPAEPERAPPPERDASRRDPERGWRGWIDRLRGH